MRRMVLSLISICLTGASTLAQTPATQDSRAPEKVPSLTTAPINSPVASQKDKAVVIMEEPTPGDHWTYELHDEITGQLKSTFTQIVTETTATNVSIRSDVAKTNESGFMTYDRSWNLFKDSTWRFLPNDGTGIRLPLSVGQTWSFQADVINQTNGITRKRTGRSKVTAQESLTTAAGTFDTFKIETSFTVRDASHPLAPKFEYSNTIWYAPEIDHWVKRIAIMRTDGQLRENNLIELTDYGRKKASDTQESAAKAPVDTNAVAEP